jgi:hypothetical protein
MILFIKIRHDNDNNLVIYTFLGYPDYIRVFQRGPASKLQLFTIL